MTNFRSMRVILLLLSILPGKSLFAQTSYNGTRAAVFDIEILQQKGAQINLKCRVANTGRQMLDNKNGLAEMLVEFDTLVMPVLLRGHEAAMAEALRDNCPKLKPGELSGPIWLNVRLKSREAVKAAPGCAEIIFDTAWVEAWNERSMRIRYSLKNKGNATAHLFSKGTAPLVNVYFVSGNKLTRGAIPVGNTQILKGRETLDGLLLPGQMMEGSLEISLKDRSIFSPNIALDFDPAQVVDECGRTGNVWILKLRF